MKYDNLTTPKLGEYMLNHSFVRRLYLILMQPRPKGSEKPKAGQSNLLRSDQFKAWEFCVDFSFCSFPCCIFVFLSLLRRCLEHIVSKNNLVHFCLDRLHSGDPLVFTKPIIMSRTTCNQMHTPLINVTTFLLKNVVYIFLRRRVSFISEHKLPRPRRGGGGGGRDIFVSVIIFIFLDDDFWT